MVNVSPSGICAWASMTAWHRFCPSRSIPFSSNLIASPVNIQRPPIMSETYRSTDLRFIGLLPVLTLKKRAACSASRSTFSTFTSSICATPSSILNDLW